jgi:hypothetical protein
VSGTGREGLQVTVVRWHPSVDACAAGTHLQAGKENGTAVSCSGSRRLELPASQTASPSLLLKTNRSLLSNIFCGSEEIVRGACYQSYICM